MRRASKCIASVLLAVLLATVLAPSFGWEASAGQAAHGQDEAALAGVQVSDEHDHSDAGIDGGSMDSHQHHGCAGHMFGHLFVTLGVDTALVFLDASDSAVAARLPGAITSFPRRLDRPPHAPELA